MAVGFRFCSMFFWGFGVSGWGFEGEGCFLWWYCLDVFYGLMDEQTGGFGCGGERVLFGQSEILLIWYSNTVFLRGNKSIFKSSSCLCIWPRLVKLEYKRFSKKWKNNRCQLPFSRLPNLKRVCLVKDWSSGTSTIIILDVWTVFGATATKIVGRDRSKFIPLSVHEPTISTSGKPPSFGRFFKTNYCRIGQFREWNWSTWPWKKFGRRSFPLVCFFWSTYVSFRQGKINIIPTGTNKCRAPTPQHLLRNESEGLQTSATGRNH